MKAIFWTAWMLLAAWQSGDEPIVLDARPVQGGVELTNIASAPRSDYTIGRQDLLEITVSDTGIGIPEAARERIFERFYRVDAARSRAVGSTGLGLSITKHLVQAMGGTIRVESEVGVGSRFIFSIPRFPRSADASEESVGSR